MLGYVHPFKADSEGPKYVLRLKHVDPMNCQEELVVKGLIEIPISKASQISKIAFRTCNRGTPSGPPEPGVGKGAFAPHDLKQLSDLI